MSSKQIGLTGQTILAIIPSLITQLIAFFRIKKYKEGVLISLGILGASIGVQMVLPFPFGLIGVFVITSTVSVRFVRRWTREYNANLPPMPQSSVVEDDTLEKIKDEQNTRSLKILKERLAKGEITKEEYEDLKKGFE